MTRSRPAWVAAVAALTIACARGEPEAGVDTDSSAAAAPDTGAVAVEADAAQEEWPATGPIDYRRERSIDLTGDGRAETVIASAHGPAYDSLDVAITIRGTTGDTLWHEAWPSLLYFKYEPIDGKADTTVARIVRDHVEQLLANDRFEPDGGLPAALSRGGDSRAIMREAIHYHLAELDYRRKAGLAPAQSTPPEAYSAISVDSVPQARVDAVIEDMRTKPSFMYYAGGEATYAIAWSGLESAFVRIFSCC